MTANELNDHEPIYTVGAVADRLGIPTATLRSWNRRYGIGPFDHLPGRHRLYTENDVAILRRMQLLIDEGINARAAARVAADAQAAKDADAASLLAAAFALDAGTAGRLIEVSLRDRGVVDTWDGLLRPAFAALTTLQIEGSDCLDVEHLLSRATNRALQRLPVPSGGNTPSAILACCDGEVHTLALEALAAGMAQSGRIAVMLGASVPAHGVVSALARLNDVNVVVLWAQRQATADASAVRSVVSAGAKAMVAGPGWNDVLLPRGVVRLTTLDAALRRLTKNQ